MISPNDFYKVMCAMVPLYFALFLGYASVKWWKIFTPEQCSGINRFVSVFAVPVLSFHFIAQNNPYKMDGRFILADTLSKLLVLLLLSLWSFFSTAGLDWVITLFSVATLPNTLVMGIPLLRAMYGDFTQSLMVQLVVLQCIIWYTLLLFLFEYRAATLLIQDQFPGTAAASISKFEIDGDVVSLDGRNPLRTESEADAAGRIRVRIRRSTSTAPDLSPSQGITPRLSNLSGAEIYSAKSPAQHSDVGHGITDGPFGYRSTSPQLSGYASSDVYSLQPTPRASNFNELDTTTGTTAANTPVCIRSPAAGRVFRQPSPALSGVRMVWESPMRQVVGERHGGKDVGAAAAREISFRRDEEQDSKNNNANANQQMPRTVVMLRLILTMVGRKLARNPNAYSSILGLLWSLISFRFVYSINKRFRPRIIACGAKMAAISMAIRFLCGPTIMSAASVATGLRGDRLHAAIVQAALPLGIVPFVFAREYGLHADILSTGCVWHMHAF
ncbi:May act as a component of the auxin efflux carrier [Asimina triloba]